MGSAGPDDKDHAKRNGVTLIVGESDEDWSAPLSSDLMTIPADDVVAVVGHSYFTGAKAINLRDRFFPRRSVFTSSI